MVSTTWPASPARQRRPVPSPARAKAGHRGRHPCRRRMLTPQRGFGPGAGEGSPRSRCPILCPVAACRGWIAQCVEELKPAFLLTKSDRHKSRESIDSRFEWNLESAGRKGLLGGSIPPVPRLLEKRGANLANFAEACSRFSGSFLGAESLQIFGPIGDGYCLFALNQFADLFDYVRIGQGGDIAGIHVVGKSCKNTTH
jgi:hypothetical protein